MSITDRDRWAAHHLRLAADAIDGAAQACGSTVLEMVGHDRDTHHLRSRAHDLDGEQAPGRSRTDVEVAEQTAAVQALVTFDEGLAVELNFVEHRRPVDATAAFLRDLAEARTAQGWGSDELIEIAQQLDGGEGP